MRLVPNQKPEKITRLFKKHFQSIAPPSVKVKVTPHHGGDPVVTPTESIEYQAAHLAMEATFGKAPIPQRSGGSIPIVALFKKVLKAKLRRRPCSVVLCSQNLLRVHQVFDWRFENGLQVTSGCTF